MMNLVPNYQTASADSLRRKLRDLLKQEPVLDHDIFGCWTPDCPKCAQWRGWAKQVKHIGEEIQARESK